MLLAIVADRVGGAAAPAGLGLVSAAAFGWRSLAPAAMYAAVGWVMGLAFTGASPTEMPWLIAAALPVPALWFADWLARRRLPHERASLRWRRIVGYSFVYGLLAIVFSVVGAAILDDALR